MGRGTARSRSVGAQKRKRSLSVAQSIDGLEEDDTWQEVRDETLTNIDVVEKYKLCANIVHTCLRDMISKHLVDGASVYELCHLGDSLLTAGLQAHFVKATNDDGLPIQRGLAFPTCISVNEIACHFTPEKVHDIKLVNGDIVRIEMAGHVDGYITTTVQTTIVGIKNVEETDRIKEAKRVICTTWQAAHAAAEMMKVGNTNDDVSDMIARVAHASGLLAARGVVSHRMKRYDEQGEQIILQRGVLNSQDQQAHDTVTFDENQVWNLDVVLMNGKDPILRQREPKTTVYKRTEVMLNLTRVLAANYVSAELRKKHEGAYLPFAVHSMGDMSQARLGCAVMAKESLLDTFPVLCTKQNQIMARFKWTVTIQRETKGGTRRLCGLGAPPFVNPRAPESVTQYDDMVKKIIRNTTVGAKAFGKSTAIEGGNAKKAKAKGQQQPAKNPPKKRKRQHKKTTTTTTTATTPSADEEMKPAEASSGLAGGVMARVGRVKAALFGR